MVNPDGEGAPDEIERIAGEADAVRDGWERTIEDTRAMADDREAAGYETVVVFSQDTSPVEPDADGRDVWGLTYLVDGDTAETVARTCDRAGFDETAVYQAGTGGTTFVVTECIDHDAEIVVFVAGAFRKREAAPLVRAATDRGEMHTHFRTLDGDVVASVSHDEPDSFFPDPQAYYSYGGAVAGASEGAEE
jgi:hypothetical protein